MKDMNLKEELKGLKRLGNPKIAGLVCNKRAPMTLRIEVDVPSSEIEDVISALDLELTPELKLSLEAILKGVTK